MKRKKFISAITAATIMFSGVIFSNYIPFYNNYNEITASAFSLEETYPNSADYTASCILGGRVDLESGDHCESITKYSDVIERNFAYEQFAENVMKDKGLVITSTMWNTFNRAIEGKLLTAVSDELRQQEVYEAFLLDYLTFSEGSTENSSLLDRAGDFADKTMKYESKILNKLLDKGIADDEKELINLIENSDSLNNPEIVETMKELNWEKDLTKYTKILDGITEVATNAADYFEALTKAMALKEVNDERMQFLRSMSEKASDNTAFQAAVDNIIYTYESSYGTIAFSEGIETMLSYGWNVCWEAFKQKNPIFLTFETTIDAMNYLFNTDSVAENNIRIIMQYTAGQYAKQVLISAYPNYATNRTEETATAFNEAYKNYLAYQNYSSEWAKNFVEAIPFVNRKVVDEWLSDLNFDIDYCNNCIERANKYTDTYNKEMYNINNGMTFNEHTYKLFNYDMTWTEAKNYCENIGGHLVTISDNAEWNFVVSLFDKSPKTLLWLGAKYNEDEKGWKWVDDTTFSYTLWDTKANEPNRCYRNGKRESYVMTYKVANPSNGVPNSDAYKWNDIFESGIFPGEENFFHTNNYCFICEWDNSDIQMEEFDIETSAGDINQNGKISISDIILMQRYLLNNCSLSSTQFKLADMNKDGSVDSFDMVLLRRAFINK